MAAPPFKVKAVYDYSSPHDDDLSFPSGQIITVVQEEDADWYIGEYNDDSGAKQSGLFPKNFVERFEPQAPPRPVRAKKEEPAAPPMESPAAAAQPERVERESAVSHEAEEEAEEAPTSVPAPAPAAAVPRSMPPPVEAAAPARAPTNASTNEPVAAQTPGKAAGPPVAEKPSSFRDRIAAFNKGSAAPVTPSKPTSSSTFIKKPFVAPPPARDAYIAQARKDPPPQKLYRREEDPEIIEKQAQDQEAAKRAGLLPSEDNQEDSEDAPRPTTLKERIALLQQQQAEQQARQMEAFAKEKPKRPQKKRAESGDTIDSIIHGDTGDVANEGIPRTSADMSQEAPIARRMSKESRVSAPIPRDTFSDGNEADHSGAGEMTEGDATEVEDHEYHDRSSSAAPLARSVTGASTRDVARQPPVEEEDEEERQQQPVEEAEEEDEMDAEARRKLELRERMAKMSGGMGMGGMFGAPMGLPQGAAKKRAPPPSAPQADDETPAEAAASSPRQRMPIMPLPGMGAPQVRSPPQSPTSERPPVVEKEPEPRRSYAASQAPGVVTDVEDLEQMPSTNNRMSMERGAPPPIPQDRPLPPPRQASAGAPPVPGSRSAPMPPVEARAVPPPPPRGPMSPSAGSESDDEMSTREVGTPQPPMRRDTGLSMRGPPPPIPQSNFAAEEPRSPTIASARRTSFAPETPSASSPIVDQRAIRGPPPIPGLPPVSAYTSDARAAPRPPPPAVPVPTHQAEDEDEDDDDDEYEGDYDTDAPSATHRDILRSHGRDSSVDTDSPFEGTPRNPASAPMGMAPPIPMAQRAMPPLPPQALDTSPRRSLEMAPRAVPPPPPSAPAPPAVSGEYDPYRYSAPTHGLPVRTSMEGSAPPRQAPALPQQPPPPPGRAMPPPVPQSPVGQMPPRAGPAPPPPGRGVPAFSPQGPPPAAPRMGPVPPPPARQLQEDSDDDTPAPSVAPVRRSVEQSRQSLDHGHIARDVDLGQGSGNQWWTQANTPPPVFQGRADVLFEIEESSTPHRGGRMTVSKDIYVLFQDYSQTVITARFDSKAPADVALEQRHEPPPPRARQDQLEAASSQYGSAIFRAAHSKANQTAGDGTALGLVLGAIRSQPTALLPVGTRAYGALIYVNIANATVQQNDEIRAGDIISFRNAKFQGKHGLSKYSDDIGKPDHVAIVVEWDGTKKKIRAYEQGRESRKVKMESFRVGDLRSGEVKVWRPMGRQWVGWEGES